MIYFSINGTVQPQQIHSSEAYSIEQNSHTALYEWFNTHKYVQSSRGIAATTGIYPLSFVSGCQPFWWSRNPSMHSIGSQNPCSHFYTGQLKHTVDPRVCKTSGRSPGMCWWNPRVPQGPRLKTTVSYVLLFNQSQKNL